MQEELTADPLSTAAERLEFLATGLQFLHEQNITPDSIDSLRQELAARRFRVITGSHGARRELSSTDGALFSPPATTSRREPQIRLTAPIASDAPPGVEITGLKYDVILTWLVDERGLVHEIVFR